MIRRISIVVCVISMLTLSTIVTSHAQESRWLLGVGLTYCSFVSNPGVNLNVTYRVVGQLHVGPDFSALLTRERNENGTLTKRKEVEYNFNAQYLFEVRERLALYPLIGVNISKVTIHPEGASPDKRILTAVNIGGGIEYRLQRVRLFAEGKFVTKLSRHDITAGVLFSL